MLFVLALVYRTIPSSCTILQKHCSAAVGGPAAQLPLARRRGQSIFFSRDEEWYPDLSRCDKSCRISLSSPSRLRAAASGSGDGGKGGGGGKGLARPRPHLAGPRAHFVMLTNRLTGQVRPQHGLLFTRLASVVDADRPSGKVKAPPLSRLSSAGAWRDTHSTHQRVLG